MKIPGWAFILTGMMVFFFAGGFVVEMIGYDALSPSGGGMAYDDRFSAVWITSFWFHLMVISIGVLLFLLLLRVPATKERNKNKKQ